jgi:uncharacterized protein (DUF2384 family)
MGQCHQRTCSQGGERAQRLQTGKARQHRAGRGRQAPSDGRRIGCWLSPAPNLDSRDVLEFAGIDRTTVSRRKASGSALSQDAAVKALQITDLRSQATEVFGSPTQASIWLTRLPPSLAGQTPLKRARTPWGTSKVQPILVALRCGAAAYELAAREMMERK